MSTRELKKEADSLRREIAGLRMDLAQGKLKDTSRIRKKRAELARILTMLRQKEILKNA